MRLDWEKFKALVHYIAERADDPSVLGSVKLNKVLWYSDVIHYMVTGKPITGETYVKRQWGPVPKHVLKAIEQLGREGKVARGKADHYGLIKNEYIALTGSDKSHFTGEEISFIDEAFEHVCMQHTAKSVSNETHDIIWKLAETGEEIPYCTVFAAYPGEVNEDDMAWAQEKLAAA
jgi:hypothetical protein